MIKRTLFFSKPYYLSLKYSQLVIRSKGNGEDQSEDVSIPVEDIGYMVLEHPQISFSIKLLEQLCSNNVAVVFCDSKHMPSSMLLPLDGHHIQGVANSVRFVPLISEYLCQAFRFKMCH